MAEHTPGPWKAIGGEVLSPGLGAPNIAQMDTLAENPVREANACLVAAAPDLLAALEAAVLLLHHNKYERDMAHAALAKARGE